MAKCMKKFVILINSSYVRDVQVFNADINLNADELNSVYDEHYSDGSYETTENYWYDYDDSNIFLGVVDAENENSAKKFYDYNPNTLTAIEIC